MASGEAGRREIGTRILSAAVLATVATLATLAGGPVYLVLIGLFAALTHRELHRVTRAPAMPWSFLVLGLCWAVAVAAWADEMQLAWGLVVASAAVSAALAAMQRASLGWAVIGALYVAVPCAALVVIREGGPELVIWLFLVVWATDTGGYLVGSTVGGPRLWPSVSPRKTWSGAAGGLALGVIVAVAAGSLLGLGHGLPGLAAVGAILSVSGQFGDLAESAWKRRFDVKDSGGIIPGHGGVMDRLDSVIGAAIVLFLMQTLSGDAM